MTPEEFVINYYSFAKASSAKSGISAIAMLAQAAWESGWGKSAPGNMLFGIKASMSLPENKRQLITTTEYLRKPDVQFPEVISVTKMSNGLYKYKIKDWFRKYDSPEESFTDHSNFFLLNKRYAVALTVKHDPYLFIDEIAKAGYATDPTYADSLKKVAEMIARKIEKLRLV
jgi:flagellar protein FlgJ